ncbi:MAG: hypothetical protein B5766_08025 [Candidatus Lumbricidophila eiseniae]|uniref:SIS domain-containing protein n=1 Tax=Candidatus Lumbricidiphila eiseniae TaxID=1969409 RepID=A0A2A6FQB0_9MICO|nr:MAG: hypothetical protein B5766_08025 [Candidatus Lumbricidophila eiseniae]
MSTVSTGKFFDANARIHEQIRVTQSETMHRVASLMAEVIARGGIVHLFGSGHSSLVVQEMFPRIGSFAGFNPIVDLPLSRFTSMTGGGDTTHRANLFLSTIETYGRIIFEDQDIRPGDVLLCSTATGINAVTVDLAICAKEVGATTIALTSIAHAMASEPSHSSGKRLHEACDVVIDLCTPAGDAAVHIDGLNAPVGGTSTIAACLIGNALVVEVAFILTSRGKPPEVMPSAFYAGEVQRKKRENARKIYERIWAESSHRGRRK